MPRASRTRTGEAIPSTTAEVMAANVRETRREMLEMKKEMQKLIGIVQAQEATHQKFIKLAASGHAAVRDYARLRGLREGQLRSEITRLTADNTELHKLLNAENEGMIESFSHAVKARR